MKKLFILVTLIYAGFVDAKEPLKTISSIVIKPKDLFELEYLEEWEIYTSIFDTLFVFDGSQKLIGQLVKDWSVSQDGKKIAIILKKDLKFSDGTDLTTKDVELTIRRAIKYGNNETIKNCVNNIDEDGKVLSSGGIEIISNEIINIHTKNCAQSILSELANSNLGIVSPKNLDSTLRITNYSVVSGAFLPTFESDRLVLKANHNNWRIVNHKKDVPGVVIYFDENKIGAKNVDFRRLANRSAIGLYSSEMFRTKYSVPIMVWYLSIPRSMFLNSERESNLLRLLRDNFNPSNLKYFKNNDLESPAFSFFPQDYNCGSPTQKSMLKKNKSDMKVVLIPHVSGESDPFLSELKNELGRVLNGNVEIKKKFDKKDNLIPLEIQRQFLGDELSYVFDLLYSQFKNLPDPENRMTNLNKALQAKSGDERSLYLGKMCKEFASTWQIPIAHRKYAFVFKDTRLVDIFSNTTGGINYGLILEKM